jgi:hypothetical protein
MGAEVAGGGQLLAPGGDLVHDTNTRICYVRIREASLVTRHLREPILLLPFLPVLRIQAKTPRYCWYDPGALKCKNAPGVWS